MGSFQDRLEAMKETWEESSKSGFANLPDGQYLARLQSAELKEMGSENALKIHAIYLIFDTDQAGQEAHSFIPVEGEYGPSLTRQFIEGLGFEFPSDPTDLEDIVAGIGDAQPAVKIKLATGKSGFQNLRILRRLEDDELPAAPKASGKAEKPAKGKSKANKPAPDPEPEEDESPELNVGDRVGWEYKGEDHFGSVVKLMDGKIRVKDETDDRIKVLNDGDYEPAPLEDESGEGEDEGEGGDIRDDLENFCLQHGLEFDDQDSDQDLIDLIKGSEPWEKGELVDEEVAMLEKIGAEISEPEAAKPTKGKAQPKAKTKAQPKAKTGLSDADLIKGLSGIVRDFTDKKVPAKPTIEGLKKILDAYGWSRKDLSADEAACMDQAGIELE